MRAEDILPQALELSGDERSRLATLLLESVEGDEGEVEEAGLDELTRRLDEHEQGATHAVPADVVFSEAWSRIKRARG